MVTVGRAEVYPIPAFCTNIELTRLNPLPASPIEAIPIARSLATPAAGAATVTVATPPGGVAADTAVGIASIGLTGGFNQVNSIFVSNPGTSYTTTPAVTISNPETISGIGTYFFNEIVQGMRSGTQARVKNWDIATGILSISNIGIGTTTTGFFYGEDVKGLTSGALFSVSDFDKEDSTDKYNEGDIFESEADLLIDFSESNPFGSF